MTAKTDLRSKLPVATKPSAFDLFHSELDSIMRTIERETILNRFGLKYMPEKPLFKLPEKKALPPAPSSFLMKREQEKQEIFERERESKMFVRKIRMQRS